MYNVLSIIKWDASLAVFGYDRLEPLFPIETSKKPRMVTMVVRNSWLNWSGEDRNKRPISRATNLRTALRTKKTDWNRLTVPEISCTTDPWIATSRYILLDSSAVFRRLWIWCSYGKKLRSFSTSNPPMTCGWYNPSLDVYNPLYSPESCAYMYENRFKDCFEVYFLRVGLCINVYQLFKLKNKGRDIFPDISAKFLRLGRGLSPG